ncbi:MAG: type II toxin-antitoxin system RelE family toxin [Armatimonadota bacterium]
MKYAIAFKRSALKEYQALPPGVQVRVRSAIDALAVNPHPAGSVALQGYKGLYRIRIGDYRVVYQLQQGQLVIIVIAIGHRRDIYQGL